jgi:hypothetical protein
MKRCKFFICTNKTDCPEPSCTGCGGEAYQNCGCDACAYQTWGGRDGDVEICEIALSLRREDMEEGTS